MTDDVTLAALQLLADAGDDHGSADRAAGERVQTACNAAERRHWQQVQACIRAASVGEHPATEQREE